MDLVSFLKEIRKIETIEAAETFLLKHGENIVDRVGAEIDRIERNLRVSFFFCFQMISFSKGLIFY